MALKISGYICDLCRVLITHSFDQRRVPHRLRVKTRTMDFCSLDCLSNQVSQQMASYGPLKRKYRALKAYVKSIDQSDNSIEAIVEAMKKQGLE